MICDRFPSFETLPVVPIPWAEEWEAHDLAAGQIGISWLPDDLWSRGKCGLKVLQYQAARLPVVANPVGMQAEMIEPGRHRLPCRDARPVGRGGPGPRGRPGLAPADGSAGPAARRVGVSRSAAWAETFVAPSAGTGDRGVELGHAPASARVERRHPRPVLRAACDGSGTSLSRQHARGSTSTATRDHD